MASTIRVRILGDASNFRKAVDESDGLIGRLGKSFAGIGTAVATAGAAVGGLGIALGAKLGIDAVGAASNLEQSVGGVEAVFGSAAEKVKEFSATSAKDFGISARAANELTAPVGALLTGLGFTQDEAADTAVQLSKLGADLAATFGGTATEAVSALGSTLRGEFDPAERFGVALSAATVEAKALSMGLVTGEVDANKLSKATESVEKAERALAETTKKYGANSQQTSDAVRDVEQAQADLAAVMEGSVPELTSQQKAQATLALIMERTAAAQGQSGREAETFAGRSARLGAQLEDLKAKIGQQLLPVAVRLAAFVSDVLLPAFEKWGPVLAGKIAPALKELIGGFYALVAAFRSPAEGITSSGLPGFFERLGIAARAAFDWLRKYVPPVLREIVGGFRAMVAAFQSPAEGITSSGLPGFMERLGIAARVAFDWVRANVPPILAAVADFMTTKLIPAVGAVVGWVRDSLIPAVQALVQWFAEKLAPTVADLQTWFNDRLRPALEDFWQTVQDDLLPALAELWEFIAAYVLPVLAKLVEFYLEHIYPMFVDFVKNIVETGVRMATLGVAIASFVADGISKIDEFVGGVKTKFGEATEFIRGLPERIREAVGDLGALLYDAGRDVIRGLIDGIRSMFGNITSVVSEAANLVPGPIKSILGINSPSKVFEGFGQNLMQGLSLGIQSGLSGVQSSLSAAAGGLSPAAMGPSTVAAAPNVYNLTLNGVMAEDADRLTRVIHEGLRRFEAARR